MCDLKDRLCQLWETAEEEEHHCSHQLEMVGSWYLQGMPAGYMNSFSISLSNVLIYQLIVLTLFASARAKSAQHINEAGYKTYKI